MTSIFTYSRKNDIEEPEEVNPIFSQVKYHSKENIIPPVGIAKPELVESFQQNLGDEDKILKEIADIEAYERETFGESAKREILSHGMRAIEGFGGGINQFLNLLTPELFENEEGMPYETGTQPQGLPGAEELHQMTKEKTGKYLEPKGEFTKASQETASDIGSMFSTGGLGLLAKFVLPLGGQAVKQSVKASGGSEKSQELGKLGFMTLASVAGLGNAPRVASEAYEQGVRMLPRGISFSTRLTERSLSRLKNQSWYKTGKTPTKAPAFEEIERIENMIKNGQINGHDAMQLRRDINEKRKALGAFTFGKEPIDKKQALKYLDDVDNALTESMKNYGERFNPQWWKQYQIGNEAFRITQRSKVISNVIEKIGKPFKSETAKILYHVAGGAALTHLPVAAASSLPIIGAAKTVQVMNRMIRSKVLRNHYLEVLAAASSGNSQVIIKALEKFDNAAEKLESKKDQSP